jgi:hypothetical protein
MERRFGYREDDLFQIHFSLSYALHRIITLWMGQQRQMRVRSDGSNLTFLGVDVDSVSLFSESWQSAAAA